MIRPLLPRLLRGLLRNRHGVAAVEFAAVIPVLVLLLAGALDVGRAIEQRMRLETAARAAAAYAMRFPEDAAGIALRIREALPGWSDVTIAPVQVTCECPGAGAAACDGTCTAQGGGQGGAMQRFLALRVTRPFTPHLLPLPTEMSGDVSLRIQ